MTFLPVRAQSVEVRAESIPPEIPTTNPSVFEASEYEYRNGDYQLGLKITKMD